MHCGVAMAFDQHTSPAFVAGAAQAVEAAGLHSLWLPEHVLLFRNYASAYPYAADGRLPGEPDGVLDPFTTLAWIAGQTSTLRLGTGVCILPQRHPVYTAKQVADLDVLSGGRFEFGIGVGWLAEEYRALGIPFAERGARANECIELMQALWTREESSYSGRYYALPPSLQNPKPVQRPHPPLIVGGESDAALRRAVRYGQGWYSFNQTPQRLADRLAVLDGLLSDAGRSRADFRVVASPGRQLDGDMLDGFAELGVDLAVLPLFARDSAQLQRRLQRLLDLVPADALLAGDPA